MIWPVLIVDPLHALDPTQTERIEHIVEILQALAGCVEHR
jgi:ABC-type phosphate transport system ATPase subunit